MWANYNRLLDIDLREARRSQEPIEWHHTGGVASLPFVGHARQESAPWWKPRTERVLVVPIISFSEMNKKGIPYRFETDKAIIVLDTVNKIGEKGAVIVTQEAKGSIALIHHRQPLLVPRDYQSKWNGEKDER